MAGATTPPSTGPRRRLAAVLGSALGLSASVATGQEPAAAPLVDSPAVASAALDAQHGPAAPVGGPAYDLPQLLRLAELNHPSIAQARARLSQVRAQLDEARFAPYSLFRVSGGVAVAPSLQGSNVFSPNTDVGLNSGLGVAWRVTLDGVVPLWTFGKITNLWDAAAANVKVHEAGVEKEADVVRLDVRRAFFGHLLARDGLALLADVRAKVDEAASKLQEKIDQDEADPIDLLKLQTYVAELDVREAEAKKYLTVTLAALRFYAGVSNLRVAAVELKPPEHQLGDLGNYLLAAKLHRPEVNMAKAGMAARTALVHQSRSMLFPDIGAAVQIGYSAAPGIANQINPFVLDPGNGFLIGAALVFQWKLDVLPGLARVRQAEAQLEEMRGLERLALGGVAVEVEQAHAEVKEWQERERAHAKAVQTAKRWLVAVQQGIDLGTVEDKELVDAAKAFALNRFQQMNAVMELDLAMSRLARATGWDLIAPAGK